jgi:enoyl-CoA hydratase/carnithine racemase
MPPPRGRARAWRLWQRTDGGTLDAPQTMGKPMPAPFEHIEYEVTAGVAHVVLDRPDKLNAIAAQTRDEIARALASASEDDAVGCLLIRGNGRAFCAGGDLGGITAPNTLEDNQAFNAAIMAFNAGIRAVPKPVIAAVHGLCLGTAMGFIAQCDFVIAADDARFGLIEGRIGHPGATDLVPVIGAAWTKFLIYTGEMIDAARAELIGLVLTVEPAGELLARATDLAERLARMPREALGLNKAAIEAVLENSGRAEGRIAGRARDAITKTAASAARAPDGRLFEDILKAEGMAGMKAAQAQQYDANWLPHIDIPSQ